MVKNLVMQNVNPNGLLLHQNYTYKMEEIMREEWNIGMVEWWKSGMVE